MVEWVAEKFAVAPVVELVAGMPVAGTIVAGPVGVELVELELQLVLVLEIELLIALVSELELLLLFQYLQFQSRRQSPSLFPLPVHLLH